MLPGKGLTKSTKSLRFFHSYVRTHSQCLTRQSRTDADGLERTPLASTGRALFIRPHGQGGSFSPVIGAPDFGGFQCLFSREQRPHHSRFSWFQRDKEIQVALISGFWGCRLGQKLSMSLASGTS